MTDLLNGTPEFMWMKRNDGEEVADHSREAKYTQTTEWATGVDQSPISTR